MTKADMADIIRRQLKHHGYSVSEAAARDAAAQILQVIAFESEEEAGVLNPPTRDAISEAFRAAEQAVEKIEQS